MPFTKKPSRVQRLTGTADYNDWRLTPESIKRKRLSRNAQIVAQVMELDDDHHDAEPEPEEPQPEPRMAIHASVEEYLDLDEFDLREYLDRVHSDVSLGG